MYYALIRTKEYEEGKLHAITIMNGDLESLLYGNHIILEKDGCFQSSLPIVNKQIGELKQSIINALCRYMQAPMQHQSADSDRSNRVQTKSD